MFSKKDKKDIVFTSIFDVLEEFYPTPASENIPKWYKELNSYIEGKKIPTTEGKTRSTIKRCMPVFDSISSGYIIYTHSDIYVSQDITQTENGDIIKNPFYSWSSTTAIGFHPIEQAPNHPNRNNHNLSYPKFVNPWSIRTPKGYSTLFIQPVHRESPFTILPGLVDTDVYYPPVNFPFVLNDVNFEGLIPAGTPIAQVIPVKRDDWKMSFGSYEDYKQQKRMAELLSSNFFDAYKNRFRQKKEYK